MRDLGTSRWGSWDLGDTRVGFGDTEVLGLGVTGVLVTSEVGFWGLEDIKVGVWGPWGHQGGLWGHQGVGFEEDRGPGDI